ncbi:MAG: MaoC/PaaZ C-terminal domain-containing protein [Myxococcota bacterium]|jgi:acyl dehydratase|nr:MaoC/PaaZ C-terminal domain-containing protein [Myxococcota bacterium]
MRVAVGDALPAWSLDRVSPERMRTVAAILRDPNPVHWDRAFTTERGLEGKVVNQSPVNVGYVVNMLHAWAGPGCLRRLRVEFPAPVFDEDQVTAGGRVSAITSGDAETLAECEVWLDRQDGTRAVAGIAWVAIPDQASSSAS